MSTPQARAVAFLRAVLAEGPLPSSEMKRRAKAAGIAPRTLFRAKLKLGVRAEKVGLSGAWRWRLPDQSAPAVLETGQRGQSGPQILPEAELVHWLQAGGRRTSSRGSATALVETLSEDALLDLLPREGLGLVIGPQGSGKSAVAHRLLDLHRGKRHLAVIGPPDLRHHLPAWITLVGSLQEAPPGAVVVFDEAHLFASARTAMTIGNQNVVHVAGLLRQRGILLLVVTHAASHVDARLVSHANALFIKKPGPFAALDRAILRPLLERAARAFNRAAGDPRPLSYVVVGPDERLAQTSLPTFWTENLSRAFATWTPAQRSRDQEAPDREERLEEEAQQRRAELEQAKATNLQRKLEQRAATWHARCLDDGLPPVLAVQVRTKALSGWPVERLKKLYSPFRALVARGVEPEVLAVFVSTRPDDLLIGELRTLAGALSTFRRWKIPEGTTIAFLRLFFLVPPEALGVLDKLDKEAPPWRGFSLANRITRRLAALAEQARVKAITEGVTQLLAYLRRPRLQHLPPTPAPPPKELVPVATPAGVVVAEVLSRAGGQVLLRLPTGRLVSLPEDGRGRSPPPRGLSLPPGQEQHLPHKEDHT